MECRQYTGIKVFKRGTEEVGIMVGVGLFLLMAYIITKSFLHDKLFNLQYFNDIV
jgi:hypothetical protein